MWKESIRNNVVIFQRNTLRIVRFYVRHSAIVLERKSNCVPTELDVSISNAYPRTSTTIFYLI